MLYLYCGENTYLIEEKLRAFKVRYRERFAAGANLHELDLAEEWALNTLRSLVETRSLFNEVKLVFVTGLRALLQNAVSEVHAIIERNGVPMSKELVLVMYERLPKKEIAKHREFFAYLAEHATVQEFVPYTSARLGRWIAGYVERGGGSIGTGAVRELIARSGEEMLLLSQELEKLLAYAAGRDITAEMVASLVTAKVEADVFKTIDALARGKTGLALRLLRDHRDAGDDPVRLMSMFAYELRVLLVLNEALRTGSVEQARVRHGLHPFVIKKNREAALSFSREELVGLHSTLAEADYAAKTGQTGHYEALEDVILAFAGL